MSPAFTRVNSYIFDPKAWSWSIPSGTTCPGAEKCLAFANRETGKIRSGPKQEFPCYSATTERYPSVRARYWANFDVVRGRSSEWVRDVLNWSIPRNAGRVRIHTAGDFFSQTYFDGWLMFIEAHPQIQFWAFTKSLPFWIERMKDIPPNLELTASYGGKHDDLIAKHNLKFALVVYSRRRAASLGLEIDTDDYLAAMQKKSFALLENSIR